MVGSTRMELQSERRRSRGRSYSYALRWFYIVTACVLLAVPLGSRVLGLAPPAAPGENRAPATRPSMPRSWPELMAFPQRFEAYFKDTFGFRQTLITLNSLYTVFVWNRSPNGKVLFGREGWLYYTGSQEELLKFRAPLTQEQLEAMTRNVVQAGRYFSEQSIRFLFVVAPDKQAIYPEYLPEPQRTWQEKPAYAQFQRYARRHGAGEFMVDLHEPLRRAKHPERTVFHATDTHWNADGAYTGYREIVEHLRTTHPQVSHPRPRSDFLVKVSNYDGDIVKSMLSLRGWISEEIEELVPKDPARLRRTVTTERYRGLVVKRPVIETSSDFTERPRAVIIRDSQFNALMHFIPEHFSHAVYVHRAEDPVVIRCIIAKSAPALVLYETIERDLPALVKQPLPAGPCPD